MKRPLLSAFSLAPVILSCLALTAHPADWPQWRGPSHDGKSTDTGLLKEWPAGGPPLAWKITGLGAGFSTVSLQGERIFTQGDKADGNYVIALNRASGSQLWASKLGKAGAPGWGGFAGPRCTPTADGDLLYAIGQYGEMACYETATGKEVWRKDFEKDFGSSRPEWGFSGSPLVDGSQVVFAPGGNGGAVVALNKTTGEQIWRCTDLQEGVHYSSLVPAEIVGTRQYLLLTDKTLAGIAAKDGKLLWSTPRKGATAVIPDPIYEDGLVYVTSGYGIGCNLFKVSAKGGQFSVEQVYANKIMVNHHGGVVKVGNLLYGFSDGKGWTCQDFKTGTAAWQVKGEGRPDKGSIVYADGNLVLREENKNKKAVVALIEANPSKYVEKGRFTPPNQSGKEYWPHPVVCDGKLYIRDQDTLLCYDLKAR
jgi:outer membrane protein assembly factor BamB